MCISRRVLASLACLTCLIVVLAAPLPAIAKGKCTYWFGFCTSCEKPMTCKNSKRSDQPAKTVAKTLKQSKPAQSRRARKPAISANRLKPKRTVPRNRQRETGPLPSAAGFDREFQQFKQFVQLKRLEGRFETNQKLKDLYFRYKLWTMKHRQSNQQTQ